MQRIAEPDSIQLEFGRRFPHVILASSSPNRRSLLETGGTKVDVVVPHADETRDGKDAEGTVMAIASRKMDAYLASPSFNPEMLAIAADTLVLIDGRLLGKPQSREDARKMLLTLSGRTQTVISASALYVPGRGRVDAPDTAEVVFRTLSEDDAERYLDTGEWMGAAGGYRLQRTGYTLVDRIIGDWTTVVGLPLRKILDSI